MTQKQTSLYDVVKERFRKGQRVTYLHRITYVGEHSFRDDPTLKQLYEEIIRDMNSEDPDEILTGFLLCYDGFFVHILEVALKTVMDHLSETVPTCLPESVLLNFVLQCKPLLDLRKYMNAHCTISASESYQETVWPIPGELVPLNLLDTEDHKFLCDMDVMTRPLPPIKEDS